MKASGDYLNHAKICLEWAEKARNESARPVWDDLAKLWVKYAESDTPERRRKKAA